MTCVATGGRSCGEAVLAVRHAQKQITVGAGAALAHGTRRDLGVLVTTGGLDSNLDLDPGESLIKFLIRR